MSTPSQEPRAATTTEHHDGCCSPHPTPQQVPSAADGPRQSMLIRRVRLLVAATISYNVIEAIVAITAGMMASSAALIGFGLDSTIEVASATAVAWQFSARQAVVRQARERKALRVIALSFFALAAYVTYEAISALAGASEPESSVAGIVLAALSLAIMPALSLAQRHTGRQLGSASAVADSKQTLLCAYLSGVLLVGLVLNAAFGWSWADPIVALVIAAMAAKEGREAWRGDDCCGPTGLALTAPQATEVGDCCDHDGSTR